MPISIRCRELGFDCQFAQEGEGGETLIESVMHHIQAEHADDWYETGEIYQAVCSLVRTRAS